MTRWLRQRLRGRPDSEHAQALVRVAIALVLVLLILWQGALGALAPDATRIALWVMAAEWVLALGLVVAILVRPGTSHPRRVLGMCADYGTLAALLAIGGGALAPLYVVLLWVTVGNGLRYGTRYLGLAIAMAVAVFGGVLAASDYWRAQLPLAIGLLLGLALIPGYLATLLRDLRQAIDAAHRANLAKSRFLANMSHEFRSPLNGIIGMAEVLGSTRLNPEQRECADVIQTSAQTLLMLVEDVLDISAIEAGKLRRSEEDFNLRELFRRIRTQLAPLAQAKGLQLQMRLPDEVPWRLHGDAAHLSQVLLNLVHNAVKFTDEGEVVLSAAALRPADAHPDDPRAFLRFEVRDTGPGIPVGDRERIFQAFEQGDDTHTRRHGGTGLGTTIARTLVELLGGRIGVEDNPGGGSLFWVELALAPARGAPAAAGAPSLGLVAPLGEDGNVIAFDDPFVRHRARVRSLRVLVADDQPANRVVVQRLLERAGHRVLLAHDGERALDVLEAEQPDIAIVDLHMPGFSGLDVLRQARVMQAGGPRTPVVVLSADATVESLREAEAAGAHAFLTKPVVVARLLEVIAEVAAIGGAPVPAPIAGDAPAPPLRPQLLNELAGVSEDPAFMRGFVDECVRDAGRALNEIERTAAQGAWEEAREAAHALKGVAENLGADALATQAGELMRAPDALLAREWRRRVGALQALAESAAVQARREVERLCGDDRESRPGPGPGRDPR